MPTESRTRILLSNMMIGAFSIKKLKFKSLNNKRTIHNTYILVGLAFRLVAVTVRIVIRSNCIKIANTNRTIANKIVSNLRILVNLFNNFNRFHTMCVVNV